MLVDILNRFQPDNNERQVSTCIFRIDTPDVNDLNEAGAYKREIFLRKILISGSTWQSPF